MLLPDWLLVLVSTLPILMAVALREWLAVLFFSIMAFVLAQFAGVV